MALAETRAAAPSGTQFELVSDGQRAVVVEVGAGLRTYSADGTDVLLGYAEDELCTSGRGQLLCPWPNRIEDGSYAFEGRTHQLPLNEPALRNAIHGLVRWQAWSLADRASDRVVLEHVLHAQPGYPFTLGLRIEYKLAPDGLSVYTSATNLGRDTCPFGSGAHPYLIAGTGLVDDILLRVPAQTVLLSDERSLPAAAIPVAGTGLDYREWRQIGAARIDCAFTALERGPDGLARVGLRGPSGSGPTLWFDEHYPYATVFTGDLPDVGRRGLAVEPMTCPPNAFRTGESLIRLTPGSSWLGSWGITPAEAR